MALADHITLQILGYSSGLPSYKLSTDESPLRIQHPTCHQVCVPLCCRIHIHASKCVSKTWCSMVIVVDIEALKIRNFCSLSKGYQSHLAPIFEATSTQCVKVSNSLNDRHYQAQIFAVGWRLAIRYGTCLINRHFHRIHFMIITNHFLR